MRWSPSLGGRFMVITLIQNCKHCLHILIPEWEDKLKQLHPAQHGRSYLTKKLSYQEIMRFSTCIAEKLHANDCKKTVQDHKLDL